MKENNINIINILNTLPHRYPFLLVDKIVDIDIENGKIVGLKNVTINEPHFQGHFPEQPVMPGVLMIEALAQVSGVLIAYKKDINQNGENREFPIFAGVDNVRFKSIVTPGDQLLLHSELCKNKRNIWKFSSFIQVQGKTVCSADLTCTYKQM